MLTIGVQIDTFCVKNHPKEEFANSNIVRANMKSNIYINILPSLLNLINNMSIILCHRQRYIKTIENNVITLNISFET